MARVIIALGSNLGDRRLHLSKAKRFLASISRSPLIASSIYETEPVGEVSTHRYYNAVCCIETDLETQDLLKRLKDYEKKQGRDSSSLRWSNRTIDLDIIDYAGRVSACQGLKVPHPEYRNRRFVLQPLQEIFPEWRDPATGCSINALICSSPEIEVFKKKINW